MARTYEEILQGVLDRIPEGYDTREGSVLWESVAPLCAEIAQMELTAEWMQSEAYIGTASGEYLDRIAKDYGFTRELAVPVTVKAEIIGGNPVEGNKFSSVGLEDEIIYQVDSKSDDTTYYLTATEYNPQSNYYVGDLAMIDFINDLKSARITEIIIPQKETETDSEFRERIQNNLIAESTDGNKQQYEKWLSEYDGVGKSKVTPLWDGVNTVKCTILNELNTPASPELIEEVQNYLDPGKTGLGEGKAPIGAVVTVDTSSELTVNVETTVVFIEGHESAPTLKDEIKAYFGELALVNNNVSYLTLASVITYNKNIDTVTELKINGNAADLPIPSGSVPVLGTLKLNGSVV